MSYVKIVPASLYLGLLSFNAASPVIAEEVDNIVVSATRTESMLKNIPLSISVITADDIRRSGAANMLDALRSNGGLEISDLFGDGTDASVGLRGFAATAPQNTLILVDGRRLNNADNSLPDLNTVAISSIEQIEIVRGSLGSLYGDKAVGGVINVITRKPVGPDIDVHVGYGSDDNRSLSATFENSHANGMSYRAGARRVLNDNYRDNNNLQLTDLFSTAAYEYGSGEVFIELQGQDEQMGAPGPLFLDQLEADRRQALNPDDYINTDTRAGRVGLRQDLSAQLELLAEFTSRRSDTAGQLSSGGMPGLFDSARRHREFTPRLNARLPLASGEALLTVGADLFATDYRIQSDFGLTDDTQQQQSAYARVVVPLTHSLSGIAGGRYGKVSNDILVDTLAFGRSLPEGTEIDDNEHAWELGLAWQFTPDWRVFGRLDRNYRFVTADEYSAVADNNFFADLFAFGQTVALPATQSGLSSELGVEWQGTAARAGLQVYQLDINDEIVFDPLLFLNTNTGDTRRQGVALEGNYAVTRTLDVAVSYNFTDAHFVSGPYDGAELTFVAAHSGSVRASYRPVEQLSGWLELVGVSDRVLGGDFANTFSELPGHVVSNLNVAYRMDQFTLALRVNNLFARQYSDAANTGFDFRQSFAEVETWYPSPGRNFMLSLHYDYR